MKINGIEIYEIVGRSVTCQEITFVPILAEIPNISERPGFPLADFAVRLAYPNEGSNFSSDPNALFVRGVIPPLFEYTPPHVPDGRAEIFELAFVAKIPKNDGWSFIPFVCATDILFLAKLHFSSTGCSEAHELVARTFWTLLVSNRDNVRDFELTGIDWCHAGGHMTQVRVGLKNGWYYIEDMFPLEDWEEDIYRSEQAEDEEPEQI